MRRCSLLFLASVAFGCSDDETTTESDALASNPDAVVTFVDPDTGFATTDVHDVEREVVRFDAATGAMIAAASGFTVSGWATDGNDLDWSGSSVAFRVRFGTEEGERRAYFTETSNGTICDLELLGPENLRVFATPERPPSP